MSLLEGTAQCWVEYEEENGVNKVYGFLVTTFISDIISGTNNLLIYSLFSSRPITDDIWIKGLQTVRKYAKANKCEKIVAYSNVERIVEVVGMLGGNVEWQFISFPV